jgi:hypothetical protein
LLERSIQILACAFHVSTDVEAVVRWLDDARPSAIQDHPVSRTHRLEVLDDPGGCRVREDGRDHGVLDSPDEAGAFVERRLHELAFAALAERTKVHAGCATWRGRRFLVIGAGRAGKTTLMTRLLVEGFSVEGDEMVLVCDGHVVAYPRRFGIRRRTFDLVPQLGPLTPALHGESDAGGPGGYQVLAFDPAQLGLPWRIAAGPVDVLLLLDGRRSGPTEARVCPSHVMVQGVMAQSSPPSTGRAAWVRDVCTIVRGGAGYVTPDGSRLEGHGGERRAWTAR